MSAALTVRIGARAIGAGQPPYVIAELGVNHNGDPKLAEALVDAAAGAGADAVKLQTFRSERLAMPEAAQATYQRERAAAASQLECSDPSNWRMTGSDRCESALCHAGWSYCRRPSTCRAWRSSRRPVSRPSRSVPAT